MNLHKIFGSQTNTAIALMLNMFDATMSTWHIKPSILCKPQFTKLCGVAKHKHCYIEWCGNQSPCQPDKWLISKNGRCYTFTIDTIRYGGSNAILTDIGRSVA